MKPLSVKHHLFCDGILRGLSQAEAYRQAGYKAKTPVTQTVGASDLMKHPNVASYLRDERAKQYAAATATREEQEAILSKILRGEIEDASGARGKAAEQLAKRMGLYAATKTEVTGASGAPLVVTLTGTTEQIVDLASMSDKDVGEKEPR
jgi:phage terminase small subunit